MIGKYIFMYTYILWINVSVGIPNTAKNLQAKLVINAVCIR